MNSCSSPLPLCDKGSRQWMGLVVHKISSRWVNEKKRVEQYDVNDD